MISSRQWEQKLKHCCLILVLYDRLKAFHNNVQIFRFFHETVLKGLRNYPNSSPVRWVACRNPSDRENKQLDLRNSRAVLAHKLPNDLGLKENSQSVPMLCSRACSRPFNVQHTEHPKSFSMSSNTTIDSV